MHEDLEMIIMTVQACGLQEPSEIPKVLARCIPFNYLRWLLLLLDRQTKQKIRTMSGYGVNPFVKCGVELCDNMLFPLWSYKPKEGF